MNSLTAITECDTRVEINTDNGIRALTFSANGEYLFSGEDDKVRVWRVEDGEEVATSFRTGGPATCLAVSQDGNWIAVGTGWNGLFVLNAKTHEKVWRHIGWGINNAVYGVDFSPDSTRLVVAKESCAATVFDVQATWKVTLRPLQHEGWRWVHATKFSPKGDRIATATGESIRVWDSNDGHLLVDIKNGVSPLYNTGLLWFNNHLFIVSDNKIKRFNASTGSAVAEWEVQDSNGYSSITLSQCGDFVAYSTHRTVSFWDPSAYAQLSLIQHSEDIYSISISPDDKFIAIEGRRGKINMIKSPSFVIVLSALSHLHFALQGTDIPINDAILDSWKHGRLVNAEESLTVAITASESASPLELACRALVRARMQNWDAAIVDAEKSIKIQPSTLAYVAKSIALAGSGERHKAYRACDIAFEYLRSTPVTYLLLIKAIVVFMAGEHDDAISRVDDLITAVHDRRMYCQVQAYMHLLVGKLRMEDRDFEGAIRSFQHVQSQLRDDVAHQFIMISLISGWKFEDLNARTLGRLYCEALYSAGRAKEAAVSLLGTVNDIQKETYAGGSRSEWALDFAQRCLSTLDNHIYADSDAAQPWKESLAATVNFVVPKLTVYRVLCEQLEMTDRVTEALECLQNSVSEHSMSTDTDDEQGKWTKSFKQHCATKLARFGDEAMDSQQHNNAIAHYSDALSLDPNKAGDILMKRSLAYIRERLWDKALIDANQLIKLDPSSPRGYEVKYAALRGAELFKDTLDTFVATLSKMSQSPDPDVHARWKVCSKTMEAIREAIPAAIRESPRVLINTHTGCLCDRSQQAAAIESSPIFMDLVLSVTTHIDRIRIEQAVKDYYRYATFSHRWEPNEPLYDEVVHIVVYELNRSSTHDKLQMFCKIVRDAGFEWAWCDTCCINKADHFVLQEALVAMFKWYEGSALTVIFLRGVHSLSSRPDALVESDWNTRVWTFQEYHASKVVRFYTEDWKPYLGLDIPNHKDSPEIISEMEKASGISAGALMALRPGQDDIREKLCLASRRQTTLVEDAAYSLLGIFSISMPVVYGEGDKALGRLLSQLLTSSGDASILAWSGKSGSFNSCLPDSITVFRESPTTHIPLDDSQLGTTIVALKASSLEPALMARFYDRLVDLSTPLFAGNRMKLPCLRFKLGPLFSLRRGSEWVFRAKAIALGAVEIRTNENISRLDSLYLVHPWIDFLLDRQPVGNVTETIPEEPEDPDVQLSSVEDLPSFNPEPSGTVPASRKQPASWFPRPFSIPFVRGSSSLLPESASLMAPSSVTPADKRMKALQVVARLKQPFGALLLTPSGRAAYRRVAARDLITVQVVEQITSTIMNQLIDSIRVLDVL